MKEMTMSIELLDERLESLERQVEDLRRELHAADLTGKPKSHIVDRVYGAMQDHPEWDEVIRRGQESRQADRVPDSEP